MLRHYFNLPTTVYVLCLGTFINRAGTMLVPFLVFYLSDELGMSESEAAAIMGLFGVGSILASLIGGVLADHVGRKAVMIGSLIGGAAVLCVFSELRGWTAIATAVLVFALLADTYRPAAQAMIADVVDPDRRPHAYSLMYLAINLGFSIAPLLGGWLSTYSFKILFLVDAVTAAGYALIIFALIKETRPKNLTADTDNSAPNENHRLQLKALRITFGWFCAAVLLLAMVYSQALVTLPLCLKNLGYTPQQYGQLIAINGVMIVVLQIPMTAVVKRFERSRVLFIAALIQGVGFGITGLVAAWPWVAVTIATWTIAEIMQAPLMPTIVSDLAPVEKRARYMGVFSMCYASAHMLGAPLGGMALAAWGPTPLWASTFGVCAAGGAIYLWIGRRLRATPTIA